ncbi:MAG: PIN domain-containing protein [Proteobacteria bacterium]|nr:PIN domain-containing protein [Pseudomonadota bacterium]
MTDTKPFLDTNILLYLLSSDSIKANKAESIIQAGGMISIQVLNEFTNVTRRKLGMPWDEISEILMLFRSLVDVTPLTMEIHDRGRYIAERYQLSVYDAMIVASALNGDCDILYTEDMHHDMLIDDQLKIHNPFLI